MSELFKKCTMCSHKWNTREDFLNDGTLTTLAVATMNGDAFTALNGAWGFSPLGSISNTFPTSYYLIETVPIPSAVWLFGSGLIGLIGIARRKKS